MPNIIIFGYVRENCFQSNMCLNIYLQILRNLDEILRAMEGKLNYLYSGGELIVITFDIRKLILQ